ncbi:unnamed protein product [Vicia faba]|uniref:Uncharacterized protein n=1 Tax=Vicia faba TaxID=3906 RepID=A0AAV1AYG0_VICFA|nr:unnamed protein product [Vicia faba]
MANSNIQRSSKNLLPYNKDHLVRIFPIRSSGCRGLAHSCHHYSGTTRRGRSRERESVLLLLEYLYESLPSFFNIQYNSQCFSFLFTLLYHLIIQDTSNKHFTYKYEHSYVRQWC